jgi:hypothetical protein
MDVRLFAQALGRGGNLFLMPYLRHWVGKRLFLLQIQVHGVGTVGIDLHGFLDNFMHGTNRRWVNVPFSKMLLLAFIARL